MMSIGPAQHAAIMARKPQRGAEVVDGGRGVEWSMAVESGYFTVKVVYMP